MIRIPIRQFISGRKVEKYRFGTVCDTIRICIRQLKNLPMANISIITNAKNNQVSQSSNNKMYQKLNWITDNVQVNVSKIPSKEFCSEPPVWRSGRMVDVVVLGSVGLVVGSVGLFVGSGSSITPSITFWMQVGVSKPGISSSPWKNEKWDENYLWKILQINLLS